VVVVVVVGVVVVVVGAIVVVVVGVGGAPGGAFGALATTGGAVVVGGAMGAAATAAETGAGGAGVTVNGLGLASVSARTTGVGVPAPAAGVRPGVAASDSGAEVDGGDAGDAGIASGTRRVSSNGVVVGAGSDACAPCTSTDRRLPPPATGPDTTAPATKAVKPRNRSTTKSRSSGRWRPSQRLIRRSDGATSDCPSLWIRASPGTSKYPNLQVGQTT
jgi:hypothetical protein